MIQGIFHDVLEIPVDEHGSNTEQYDFLREWYFGSPWFQPLNLIEHLVAQEKDANRKSNLVDNLNGVLQMGASAYRVVDGLVSPITSDIEIAEINDALSHAEKLDVVSIHIRRALELLSDRDNPDYRNSIKESISSVESACKILLGSSNAKLTDALSKFEKEGLHPALSGAFAKLYGFTSSSEGIRHALVEKPDLKFEDAKFMLVICSAFANYLIAKFPSQ